ncbi:tripartite tricarboxylate transporter TctB family protein [Paracoccus tegillarcae]|uniref:Tripartite tricarboxylate transporter TctB family protein n=1 Tax=Paracoccus tegillarcae TaxID=1529068 RepID=A0A2K9F1F1_9RHOB|nr:tripartite tricarboxylate transporter TctB family protein [Paracoccus tegillarcae]AUH35394.1 tripartite tricarboxylate transporter TctB family protein [Paracoccus tegillarcae]
MSPTDHDTDAMQDFEADDLHEERRDTRRPGEAVFAFLLLAFSLFLLWSAYDISGFEALSAPGTVPMATTLVMVIAAALIATRTRRLPPISGETFKQQILPPVLIVMALLLLAFGVLLRPLGFLPTAALFLTVAIKMLWRQNWGRTLAVALGSLLLIYVIFRIIFTVLMPSGVFPEAEMLQFFRNLFGGGA